MFGSAALLVNGEALVLQLLMASPAKTTMSVAGLKWPREVCADMFTWKVTNPAEAGIVRVNARPKVAEVFAKGFINRWFGFVLFMAQQDEVIIRKDRELDQPNGARFAVGQMIDNLAFRVKDLVHETNFALRRIALYASYDTVRRIDSGD